MTAFFSHFLAAIIIMPVLGYIIIFVLTKQITKKHRKAVHFALDGSTILFILSVHYLIVTIWGQSYLWLLLLAMIVVAMIVAIVHWKVKEEVDFVKVFRGAWRFNFLLFFAGYIVLLAVGLIMNIMKSLS